MPEKTKTIVAEVKIKRKHRPLRPSIVQGIRADLDLLLDLEGSDVVVNFYEKGLPKTTSPNAIVVRYCLGSNRQPVRMQL